MLRTITQHKTNLQFKKIEPIRGKAKPDKKKYYLSSMEDLGGKIGKKENNKTITTPSYAKGKPSQAPISIDARPVSIPLPTPVTSNISIATPVVKTRPITSENNTKPLTNPDAIVVKKDVTPTLNIEHKDNISAIRDSGNRNGSKLIIMNMMCDLPHYIEEEKVISETWCNPQILNKYGIRRYTYCKSEGDSYIDKENNVIYTNTLDDIWHTFSKTKEAFRILLENEDFEWVLKTNCSTFINLQKILGLLPNLHSDEIWGGGTLTRSVGGKLITYVQGNATLIHRNFVKYIAESSASEKDFNGTQADDNIMGWLAYKYLGADYKKHIHTFGDLRNLTFNDIQKKPGFILKKFGAISARQYKGDRNDEIKILRYLFSKIGQTEGIHSDSGKMESTDKTVVAYSHGRLGNILFSLASGRYYADRIGAKFYLFNSKDHGDYINTEIKDTFLKDISIIDTIDKSKYKIISDTLAGQRSTVTDKNIFLDGYRENPAYWSNDKSFIHSLIKPEDGIIDAIRETYKDVDFPSVVSINIRRGDYTESDVMRRLGLLKLEWFEKCMSHFPSDQKYLITSDDMDFCKKHFVGTAFIFGDREVKGYPKISTDLWIQTICAHNIISNSTFSWWGAYLNTRPTQKVYCPYRFFVSTADRTKIPNSPNWIIENAIFEKTGEFTERVIHKDVEEAKICYTAILNSYDHIRTPRVVTPGWRYICYSDKPFTDSVWEYQPMPKEILDANLDVTKKQRKIKILFYKYLPKHSLSIYVDGNISIRTNLDDFIEKNCKDEVLSLPQHFLRNCLYEEAKEVIRARREKREVAEAVVARYEKEGFPHNYGLTENNVIIRKNVPSVRNIMDQWWYEEEHYSKRDQLSLMYVLWKNNFKICYLPKDITRGKGLDTPFKHDGGIHRG